MKLITVKEYAKQQRISETAVRKRVTSKLCKSVQFNDLVYIVVKDNSPQIIKDLKSKIRLLNSNIKTLKAQATAVQNQADYIKRLENRVDTLEEQLQQSTAKKEELYEKVINTVMIAQKQ